MVAAIAKCGCYKSSLEFHGLTYRNMDLYKRLEAFRGRLSFEYTF
jgi:hypothetical protein